MCLSLMNYARDTSTPARHVFTRPVLAEQAAEPLQALLRGLLLALALQGGGGPPRRGGGLLAQRREPRLVRRPLGGELARPPRGGLLGDVDLRRQGLALALRRLAPPRRGSLPLSGPPLRRARGCTSTSRAARRRSGRTWTSRSKALGSSELLGRHARRARLRVRLRGALTSGIPLRPISLQRFSLLRLLDLNFPGKSLWT